MKPEEENIARLLKKRLPAAQQEAEVGKRVFYRLLLARTESPATSLPNDDEDDLFRKSRPRLSMVVAISAAVAASLFILVLTSGLWRRAENLAHIDESVVASNSAGRLLDLPDGSQVEMHARSRLRIDHADDGLRVRLSEGSVIVTAAKQSAGHLYVETKDAIVSVVGTVFVVSVEEAGSRVGVIEGVVDVRHGAISQKLFPGQQLATNPAMEQIPLDVQVSWSRSAAIYLALLKPPVAPAPPPAAAATTGPPQSKPAAASQSSPEAGSLLIIGPANYGAGQRSGSGNNRPGTAPNDPGRALTTTPEAERAMEQALISRELFTDVSFIAEANYFQSNRAEYFVPVTLKIPGTQLAGSENAKRIFLDIIGQVMDAYGTTIVNFRDAVDLRLPDETAKELPARQIAFDTGFILLPGKYFMKFLVRDRITDRIGTYQTDFVIPSLMKENTNLPTSSVVLSSELINPGDALSNVMQTPISFADSQFALDPLVIDGKKLIPSSTRTFSRRRDLIVFVQAYEPNATATEPLTASVAFYRGQTKVFEAPPLTVRDDLGRKWRTLPVKLVVPLSTLPSGEYDCQVTVLDPTTQKSVVWRSPITVVD
jgi:hypothetical protein